MVYSILAIYDMMEGYLLPLLNYSYMDLTPQSEWLNSDYAVENRKKKMTDDKKSLYEKVLDLIPILEQAIPRTRYNIGNHSDGAILYVRGFNASPEEKVEIELLRRIPNLVGRKKDEQNIEKTGYANAPFILFEFNKRRKQVIVHAIRDERPSSECDEVRVIRDIKGNKIELNTQLKEALQRQFNQYLDEFKQLGFTLLEIDKDF